MPSGWGVIALGLLGGSWFAGDSELVTALTFVGSKHVTTGSVISAGETGAERAEPILEVHYRYAVDGVEHEGESYSLSATFAPGETVRIEYLDALPSSSRIVGLRKRRFGMITSFVFGFVVLGIGLLWTRRVQLRDCARLLREAESPRRRSSTGGRPGTRSAATSSTSSPSASPWSEPVSTPDTEAPHESATSTSSSSAQRAPTRSPPRRRTPCSTTRHGRAARF